MNMFGSDDPIVLTSMQGKGESLMGAVGSDQGSRVEGFYSWTIMQDPTQQGTHSSPGMGDQGSRVERFYSWTIMQDPTQQGTQKNTFVAWDGRDGIARPTVPNQTFSCIKVSAI
ncbi:hypothetical protein AVEN_181481-1 [Araneus ventricosus]|uniref:Uncharacterized protein n=1 Tax=Araneus ventricosus TaxID=182803 RepID=A0A4Y2F2P0_ARAVE|nr:hypothetical protein AVEN_181481-1 [Araneus ventricosus]